MVGMKEAMRGWEEAGETGRADVRDTPRPT